jgi:hypothetical protein
VDIREIGHAALALALIVLIVWKISHQISIFLKKFTYDLWLMNA